VIDPLSAGQSAAPKPGLARQLGLFDATMLVMGGIVGSGIFINPYVVAQQVHTTALILAAWILGGVVGLGGAFIWAELAATLPEVGGQYGPEAWRPWRSPSPGTLSN
jgi:APA family basic amino acid/polyamine antiporter